MLAIDEEQLGEVEVPGFNTATETLACGNVLDTEVVQVCDSVVLSTTCRASLLLGCLRQQVNMRLAIHACLMFVELNLISAGLYFKAFFCKCTKYATGSCLLHVSLHIFMIISSTLVAYFDDVRHVRLQTRLVMALEIGLILHVRLVYSPHLCTMLQLLSYNRQ